MFLDRVSGPDERRQPRRLRPVDPLVELASGDVWSRKVVGWRVFDREDNELSAKAFVEIYEAEGADPEKLVLHSDDGGPMKGATMVATLESLGVTRSLSRPSVSNDNPFVESTFRTVKGRPSFPDKPFESLDAAETWVAEFAAWYNEEHRHSGISFVTPGQRHTGVHEALLEHREHVYAAAKARTPSAGPATLVAGIATRPSDSTQHTCLQEGRPPPPTPQRRETSSCGNFLEIHRHAPSDAPRPTSILTRIGLRA